MIINVDLPQFTKVKSQRCTEKNLISISNDEIKLDCGTECHTKTGCNFLCKWISKKNNYLFTELDALREYLNSAPDNYFDTKIEVVVRTSDKSILNSEQFSYLSEFVEGK